MADSWENLPDVKKPDDWEQLPDVVPAGKAPSPTGWRDVEKPADSVLGRLKQGLVGAARKDMLEGGLDRQNEAMAGAVASGLHGAAGAMEGPINGAIDAAQEPTWDRIVERYKKTRDDVEGNQKENLRRFPNAPLVGAVLAGGAGQAPTRAGRLLMGGLQGAEYGLGSSKHNLTDGDAMPAVKDALKGGAVGLGGAAAGEVLNAGAQKLGDKLTGVLGKNTDAAQSAADKVMRSAISAHGGDVSAGSNQLKMLRDALTNPDADPALAARARAFLASDEGKALLNRVLSSNIGRAEGQVGRIQASQAAMQDAIGNTAPDAVGAVASARLNDSSALTRRAREVLPKILLPAAGGMLAGPPGAAAGALGAAVLGRSGTTVRNMLTDPYVSSRMLGAGTAALSGAGNAMSKSALPLAEWSRFLGKEEDKGDE